MQLIATCQCHMVCSPAYCLRTKHGKQECHFHYPKALCEKTELSVEDGNVELQTARNDPLINSLPALRIAGQCRYAVLCLQAEGDFILCQVCYQV